MDIKDFIKEAIQEITLGLKDGQVVAVNNGFRILDSSEAPKQLKIEFDIAIIAKEETTGSAGIGLKVIGADIKKSNTAESVSRVKFQWYLVMPEKL